MTTEPTLQLFTWHLFLGGKSHCHLSAMAFSKEEAVEFLIQQLETYRKSWKDAIEDCKKPKGRKYAWEIVRENNPSILFIEGTWVPKVWELLEDDPNLRDTLSQSDCEVHSIASGTTIFASALDG